MGLRDIHTAVLGGLMDVLRLTKSAVSTFGRATPLPIYYPDLLVENLSSVIWTERYQDFGQFEFRSSDIEATLAALPEASLVTLRDTQEVMIVENHSIEVDGEGHVLVVTGRSAEKILEDRAFAEAAYGKKLRTKKPYTIADMLLVYLWNAVGNETTKSVLSAGSVPFENAIPSLKITDSTVFTGTSKYRYIENGQCYSYMRDWIGSSNFGIRMIRPPLDGKPLASVVSVTTAGAISKPDSNKYVLQMNLYEGLDRTQNQDVRSSVIFSVEQNHFEDGTYLLSSKDFKTVALVISGSGPRYGVEAPRPPRTSFPVLSRLTGDTTSYAPGEPRYGPPNYPKGWDRRVVLVDAGSKEDTDTVSEFLESLPDVGNKELVKNYDRITMFDGALLPGTPYKFKEDYDLGDKVTLLAKYGIEKDMQVMEYTRTEDINGERGIPALSLWTR